MNGFGSLEFQLVLLRRMADFQPGWVEDALRALKCDRARMRANRRWQARRHASGGRGELGRYRSALGPPEAEERRRLGDLECRALRWPVPLWPSLRFEVLAAPGGGAWHAWLVRAPGTLPPVLRTWRT